MTTEELITALFYEVDEQLHAIPKHPEASKCRKTFDSKEKSEKPSDA